MGRKKYWLVIVPLILFAMLAVSIEAGVTVGFEGWAYSEAVEHMSPVLTAIVRGITHLGDGEVIFVLCLLLFAIPRSRKTIALPVSVAVIVSWLLNVVLKQFFARQRPDILRLINETSYSFPSGHAMVTSSLYVMLILMVFRFMKEPAVRTWLTVLCIALAVAIGFSRVYLGVHYAGDVLGGWLIGSAISLAVYYVWRARADQAVC